jgi:Protein of unknown function (DUF3999)
VKLLPLLFLFFWQAVPPSPSVQIADRQYLRYQRSVALPHGSGQSCVVIDAQVFPHASPSLKDLRLYQGDREIPYAITLSEPEQLDSDTARVLNLGLRRQSIVFDLEMPHRPYTDVVLDLAGQDFIATATVSGTNDPNYSNLTQLGEFTLFDLTTQHLSRSTTLHLQETSFPYLHVELTASAAPGTRAFKATPQMVRGVSVPPSREAQSLYTTAAVSTDITQRARQTVATFALPERVPIERVSFTLDPDYQTNFSRDVHISDRPAGTPASSTETVTGTIYRVRLTQAGRQIHQQQLSIPATLGSNMQSAATAEVAIDNGDDKPLPITEVRLEMRQRKLCFDAPSTQPLTLFYGDAALTAPQYDYARLFAPDPHINVAQLNPERANPNYHPRPDTRPLTERNPSLLWIALLAVICILAVVAIRSSRPIHR